MNYTSFFSPSLGGIETHIQAFAKYSNHKHYVLTDALENCSEFDKIDDIDVYRIWPTRSRDDSNVLSNGIEYFLGPIREVNKTLTLNKLDFDVLNLHGSYGFIAPWELWFPPIFSTLDKFFRFFPFWKLNDKPMVLTIHSLFGYDSPDEESLLTKIFSSKRRRTWIYFKKYYPSLAKYILCVTPRVRDILSRICETENVLFIPSGVDSELFKPMEKNEAFNNLPVNVLEKIEPHKDCFLVLYFARFDALKGTHLLKKFADSLPDNVKLIVAGYGDTRLLSKSKNLVYVGKVDNYKMPALINACDVVFAPILHRYTTPRVIYETMGCGKPIIVMSQFIRFPMVEKKNAFLVNDVDDAIKTVAKLYNDPKLCQQIGQEAIIASHKNSVQLVSRKVDKLYEKLVGN